MALRRRTTETDMTKADCLERAADYDRRAAAELDAVAPIIVALGDSDKHLATYNGLKSEAAFWRNLANQPARSRTKILRDAVASKH